MSVPYRADSPKSEIFRSPVVASSSRFSGLLLTEQAHAAAWEGRARAKEGGSVGWSSRLAFGMAG